METKEHIHLQKLIALEERILYYYIVNHSKKDDEGNLEFITDLRRKCMKDTTHRIGKWYMQTLNHLWHQYKINGNMKETI